jgi:ribonuclease T2
MREFVYRCAAMTAFILILCITAFAQDSRDSDLSQIQSGAERFGQGRSGQDRSGQDRFQRFDQRGRNFDQRNQPGHFDFYVLALSWSPSFCETSRERNQSRSQQQQCGSRPYSFVVHGLWPQHERGFPRDCQVPAPRLARSIVDTMLDLMPSPRLVFNQWDRHGTCSGLNGQQFFETLRKAREAVQIPAQFEQVADYKMVTPDEVEDAFVAANPGLSRDAIAVTCDSRRLSEVRICMSKELKFRGCPEIDRRSCRNEKVVMPPVRGS